MGGLQQCCTANWPCAPISLGTTGRRKQGPIGAPCGPAGRSNAGVRRHARNPPARRPPPPTISWPAALEARRAARRRASAPRRTGAQPVRERCFEEVRDDLWTVLSLPGPTPQQGGFWPRRGPVRDSVALVPRHRGDGVLLVEAKSHAGELKSGGTRATGSTAGPVA